MTYEYTDPDIARRRFAEKLADQNLSGATSNPLQALARALQRGAGISDSGAVADSGTYTAPSASRRKLAEALYMQAVKPQQIQHWTQGVAQVMNAGIEGYFLNKSDKADADFARQLQMNAPGMQPSPAAAPQGGAPVAAAPQTEAPQTVPSDGGPVKVVDFNQLNELDNYDLKQKIKKFEGFAPKAQWDYAQNTNGYGTKAAYAGEPIDRATAEDRLGEEVAKARVIADRVNPNMSTGASDALTSLTMNAGPKWTGAGLGQAVQAGDMDAAKQRLLQYNQAGGQTLPGLVNRRQAEAQWMMPKGDPLAGMPQPNIDPANQTPWTPVGGYSPDPRQPQQVASLGGMPSPDSPMAPQSSAGQPPQMPGSPPAQSPPMAMAQNSPPMAQGVPQIPPQAQQYIRLLLSNPETRQKGLEMLNQYQKPAKPTYGVIGKDQYGRESYGWINSQNQTTTPNQQFSPQPMPADSVIPQAPPGVDPKVWREEQSKAITATNVPGSPEFAMNMRKEVSNLPSYKNITQAAPVYKSMVSAAGRDTRAADVNLIYGLAKIMDPNSVVRESEMTVAQAVATLPQYLQAQVQSQIQGTGRLDKDVRAAIMEEAHSRIGSYQSMFDQDAGMYRGIAQRQRLNPEDVVPKFGPFDPYQPAPPGGSPPPPSPQDIDAEMRRRGLK